MELRNVKCYHTFLGEIVLRNVKCYHTFMTDTAFRNVKCYHTLELRVQEEYFNLIKSGEKVVEARPCYKYLRHYVKGDPIKFVNSADEAESFVVRIAGKQIYGSFEEMLEEETERRQIKSGETVVEVTDGHCRHKRKENVELGFGPQREVFVAWNTTRSAVFYSVQWSRCRPRTRGMFWKRCVLCRSRSQNRQLLQSRQESGETGVVSASFLAWFLMWFLKRFWRGFWFVSGLFMMWFLGHGS